MSDFFVITATIVMLATSPVKPVAIDAVAVYVVNVPLSTCDEIVDDFYDVLVDAESLTAVGDVKIECQPVVVPRPRP